MAKSIKKSVEKKPQYDPSKVYNWQPNDEFTISGSMLDILNKTLAATLQAPEAQKLINAYIAYSQLQMLIKDGVEEGTIVLAPESPQAE